MRVGFPWISLDSLVRIETFQGVARDKSRKVFLASFSFERPQQDSRALWFEGLLMGKLNWISD